MAVCPPSLFFGKGYAMGRITAAARAPVWNPARCSRETESTDQAFLFFCRRKSPQRAPPSMIAVVAPSGTETLASETDRAVSGE